MSFASAIHNPLAINLRRQKDALLSSIPSNTLHHAALKNASTTHQLLSVLSTLLAVPAFTKLVATLFRPILNDLCARWLENEDGAEDHLVALCYLVEVHEELFPILNHLLLKFFEDGPLSFITENISPVAINTLRLQRLILAYYRILQANRELPLHLSWSLSPLATLIWTPHLNNGVRLLAIRCYSLQSGMGEAERCKLEEEILGAPCGVDCQLNYGQNLDGTEKEVDGWIMPVVELKRVQEERDDIVTEPIDYFSQEESDSISPIDEADMSPLIANVHGVLLLRTSPTSSINTSLIPLPSSIVALRQLAFHISIRLPTLLTSAPSAGKALLLSHLATVLHPDTQNQIVPIHLADTSLDPRALLGSYVSSTTRPGTFEWKEGVLVRSMREGKWVVFEDIDRGSNEVLGVIKPLVESLTLGKWIGGRARLNVPSRGTVIAHADFMLFATRSTPPSRNNTFHPPTFFGAHKFSEVIIHAPSSEELTTIVNTKFPRLAGSAAKVTIDMWDFVRKLGTQNSGRDVGLRELQKFCQRVDRLLPASHQSMDISLGDEKALTFADIFPNPSLREDMYLEARDVFFGAGTLTTSARAHAETIAQIIAEYLHLDSERQQWLLHRKAPELEVEKDANGRTLAVRVGRTRLAACTTKSELSLTPVRPFAMHKPALSLLSRIANAVSHGEPVLLTGETGTGKTSVVSHLASLLHRPLISLNLSHQTESSDLIGGLKPIDARIPGSELQERFLALFGATFSRRKNEKFEAEVRKSVTECKWKRAVGLWKESTRLAMERIQLKKGEDSGLRQVADEAPRKRRKTERSESKSSEQMWSTFLLDVENFEVQHVHGKGKFAFGFVEGPLVKALRSGDWVLLDEVNLASPETLECISSLLQGPTASITLTEHGSLEPVPRHADFRLFACMNPATDVGKKDLPPNIRSRFTEIDVPPPDADKDTLLSIITQYIGHIAVSDKRIIMDIAQFYTAVKQVAESRQIADGSNHRPHFSMRTLVRALTFAGDTASSYSLRRSIWEGCLMAFTMVLDGKSAETVVALARKHLLADVKNPKSLLSKDPQPPSQGVFIKFGPFYLEKGPLEEDFAEDYIITPSVEQKLIGLSRIILTRRFPVLIEGPTSAGKTSSVEYLAKRTGHRFVRINNHEHTDIQEYLGSYVSDPVTGKLVFKDGLLVQALRHGHWIVLDELNLAPTDVLEALNRLLDDNRELVIPETQEIVRPHPHFMLFATQNPPGLYAGRKVLSRAFRNRFLEVHFEDVPQVELETILCRRCQIAPSYGKRIVSVFRELQKRRQTSRVFESKQGFATLRDLFRWAGRDAVGYQELAENGYMLLAERARRSEDKLVVKEVMESVMGVKIDEDMMYDLFRPGVDMNSYLGRPVPTSPKVIWTKAMQRLYILVCRGLKFNEPMLLVGETGSGKTSVCQVFADASSQRLITLNCHQNTETADLIGGLRPVRNRGSLRAEIVRDASLALKSVGINDVPPTVEALGMKLMSAIKSNELARESQVQLETIYRRMLRLNSIFEWHDGPLVEAMHRGDVFLLDEISLADDSVLERLNSVLEPGRSIILAERGGMDSEGAAVYASQDFKLLATMNPGGDYGKKELSPALRNRFTEVWVPPVDDLNDLQLIVGSLWQHAALRPYTLPVLHFIDWLCLRVGDRSLMTLRDILAWVTFMNAAYNEDQADGIPANELFHHAAHMTYLDGLSSLPQLATYSRDSLDRLRSEALHKLQELAPLTEPLGSTVPPHDPATFIQLGSFAIPKGKEAPLRQSFNFNAPTTLDNAMRIIRACQVPKPILLEGSPGVGKTSLVTALANLSGHKLCRINLSDQTDLIDLFGSDLPVEGGAAGEFAWKDAEFLRALQEGHWVLLDEMNLAPQAVLEGLNAVLDHRGTVYVPELNRSFERHPSFRIFAAQNPLHQGGGRKGLPKSFVNRFTKVYVEELSKSDFYTVCSHIFSDIDEPTLRAMISFNNDLNDKIVVDRAFAQDGSPWEFNLRDVIRWGTLISTSSSSRHPQSFLRSVYLQRFRSLQDRRSARALFEQVFPSMTRALENAPPWTISQSEVKFGHFLSARRSKAPTTRPKRILKMHLSALESLGDCVAQSWLAILTGPKSSGKTEIVRTLADFSGNTLWEVPVNNATDTMDILGSFEQVDTRRRLLLLIDEVIDLLNVDLRSIHDSREFLLHQRQIFALRTACEISSMHGIQALAKETSTIVSHLVQQRPSLGAFYHEIYASLEKLAEASSSAGRFEWVDGPLIKAMKSGHWILLDGANLCGPSVLDRLNSLCEPNGLLTLSERGIVDGEVQQIKPHPHFRLFMTVDPHYGELSRAMRNRGIEIALFPTPSPDDVVILHDYYRLPISLATSSADTDSVMFDAHRRGLLDPQRSKLSSFSSTGRSLDQDSALSHLVDQAPGLLFSSSLIGEELAWIHFLSQTLSPGYMTRVVRYCASQSKGELSPIIRDFLVAFPQQNLTNALQVFRSLYVQQHKTSAEFVLTQPMNLYWTEGMLDTTYQTEDAHRRSMVFEILNLSATLFTSEHQWIPQPQEQMHLPEKNRKVYRTVIAIRGEMINIARLILMRLAVAAVNVEELRLASQLLGLSVHLKGALDTTSYDFSTLYAISNWLRDSLEKSSSIFASLLDQSKGLHAVASLSTGLGLFTIWSKLYLGDLSKLHHTTIRRIDMMAASLKDTANVPVLRLQSFNVVSVESLPPTLNPQNTKPPLSDLRRILDEYLTANATGDRFEDLTFIDLNTILLELQLLAHCTKSHDLKTLQTLLNGIVELACGNKKMSLVRLVPYQHLIWAIEARADKLPLIARAQLCWLEGLWNASSDVLGINGPAILFHPAFLHNIIQTCDMSRVSLRSLADHGSLLRRQVQLTALESARDTDRVGEIARVLFQTLSLIAGFYSSSYNPAVYHAIQDAAINTRSNFIESVHQILSLLQASSDVGLVSAIQKELVPLLGSSPVQTPSQALGVAWLGVSKLLLNLIVPDTPMDPAAVQNSKYRRLQCEEFHLNTQLRLHRRLEGLLTGNENNDISLRLAEQLAEVTVELEQSPSIPKRSDVHRLHLFWSEVEQFQKNVLPPSKIDPLLHSLLRDDDEAYKRERVVQESLAGFYQRLDVVYPDFSDINILLKLAINYMRLGLRAVVECRPNSINNNRAEWAASLLAFPPALCSTKIIDNFRNFEPSNIDACRHVLLALTSFALIHSLDLYDDHDFSWLETAYEQLTGLWLIDRAKEKQSNDEANSLYRRSKMDYTAATDAELEEEEFLLMFPNFEGALDAENDKRAPGQQRPSLLVQPRDMINLLLIHHNLMDPRGESTKNNAIALFLDMRSSSIRTLMSQSPDMLPQALDQTGLPFQFSLIHDSILSLETNHTFNGSSYNFYSDPNYKELKKCASIIFALRKKLQSILEEWPDQMVVKHLLERCDDILNVSSESPVAKLLSMVEQLLVQSEDWEMYSNRTNSIRTHQDEIVRLVVDWRRLELSCWQGLLDSQAKAFAEDLSEWWFRLYDAVIRGTLSALIQENERKDNSLDSYLESLIPLLDSFITSSPLGQFHARLKLLSSFETYIAIIGPLKHSVEQLPLQRVGRILGATCAYYALFSNPLQQRFLQEKAVLESEVKALIKLASWKDINVQALKQSAQRSHRQLYKIVKKFRDTLRQPVADQLRVPSASDGEQLSLSADNFSKLTTPLEISIRNIPGIRSTLNHLLNLNATFEKFSALVGNQLLPFIHSHLARSVDDAAVEIITTSRSLASLAIPSSLSDDLREKHRKALLVRKRKAWTDMLKELKHAGLASNVTPEILRQNASQQWIREQVRMPRISSSAIDVDKSEIYFTKLCGALPSLRSSIPTHHSDLTTRELNRCQMFLEAGFSMAVNLRSRLVVAIDHYQQFQNTLNRLRILALCNEVLSRDNLVPSVFSVKTRLSKTLHALSELRDNSLIQARLGGISLSDAFFAEVTASIEATKSLVDQVDSLFQALRATPLSFLTTDENDIILQADGHLQKIMDAISGWQKQQPQLNYLLSPLHEWLSQQQRISFVPVGTPSKADDGKVETLLSLLLINVQSVAAKATNRESDSTRAEQDKYILDGYQSTRDITHLLNLSKVNSQLNQVLAEVSSHAHLRHVTNNIVPFLETYSALVKDQLAVHNDWTKSLFKLNYVLCSVLQTICQQGFCQPPESGNGDEGEGEMSDATGGVGIGEGSGTNNASKEIEDESQIEGLKGENEESKDPDAKQDDDDAIEMADDVGGVLEDVPELDSDHDAASEDGSEPEFDETLENLDDLDPAAVDEKMWGDEKPPENSDEGERKADEDHSNNQADSSEVVANESAQQKKQKGEEKTGDGVPKDEEPDTEVEEDKVGEEGPEEPSDPNLNGAQMDEYVPDANTLDLPDEMDLGMDGPENDAETSGIDEDKAMEEDARDAAEETQNELEDFPPAKSDVEPEPSTENAEEDMPTDETHGDLSGAPEAKEEEEKEEDGAAPEVTARPDVSAQGEATDSNELPISDLGESTSTGEAGTSVGKVGEAASSEDKAENDDGNLEVSQAADNAPSESTGTGSATTGVQQGKTLSQTEIKPISNPLRSLGDTLREIQQRFDEILHSEAKDVPREQTAVSTEQSQLEYLHPDDVGHEMQALGPAGEEQVAKLNELTIIDEDMQANDAPPGMDIDRPIASETHEEPMRDIPTQQENGSAKKFSEDKEGAIMQATLRNHEEHVARLDPSAPKEVDMKDNQVQDVELQLKEWRATEYPSDGAERIWRLYESMTHDLAYTLCEQLRLILEPTLATRLKGDYRTGKRLNMKKVISYIASDFTKDKIWLRRTKPSQREYQVLISIDDSRSMAESHSVHLAYQTLALISKALTRLESGDIGIAKFGETVDLLHGFDEGPFSDRAGMNVINAFRFNQKATNVLSLLETSLKVLENARERKAMSSASAADLWQLQIIISDGMCQDHAKLRTILRKAEEQRVMIVFIVLDSLHPASTEQRSSAHHGSILTMDKADFKNVDGKVELLLQKYLDTFPFEYYVILREVEALPEVLAGTLKQFFERISEE